MREEDAWYALIYAQLSPRAALRLLEAFQHPSAIFAETPHAWVERARLTPNACERLLHAVNQDYSSVQTRIAQLDIRLIHLNSPEYPSHLRAIADPPPAIFIKGRFTPDDDRAIAMVGSRRASPYGRHVAAELAYALAAQGFTIVSGMAIGADTAAHEGALRAGGRTIAVLGSGIDVIYPPEHISLYDRIATAGAVISEFPPGAPPTGNHFPQRNRIISGLCLGVVVVEAPEKSGALITAAHALDQGREVFAIPGSVNSVQSKGTHQLLRDGARLVESAADIIDELSLQITTPRKIKPMTGPQWGEDSDEIENVEDVLPIKPPSKSSGKSAEKPSTSPPSKLPITPSLSPEEDTVLRLLSATAKQVDTLIEESLLNASQVNASLLMLELKGLIQRRPGNLYVRLR